MEQLILIIAALITSSISAAIGMGGGIILLGIMAILIPHYKDCRPIVYKSSKRIEALRNLCFKR